VSADGRALPERAGWGAGFAVDAQQRLDGSLLLTPRAALGPYEVRATDALELWAARTPDRLLVARRVDGGEWRRVSYGEMLQRVRALAAGLTSLQLSAERPLAILSGNSIEHWTLALAAQYAGVPYCPISPAYSQSAGDFAKLRYVIELLTPGAVAAFDTARFAPAIEATVPAEPVLIGDAAEAAGREVLGLTHLESGDVTAVEAAHARVGADTIAKFLLTSGSTGRPKAVITTHRMLCSNQAMLRAAIPFVAEEPPTVVDWLPWNHTYGGSHNLGVVLFNGGSLFIDDGRPTETGFAATVRNLSEIAPTVYFNVPKGFEMLAQCMDQDANLRRNFFSRLRACFFAGAGLSQHTWDALERHALAVRGERVPILSGIGATETSPAVTFTSPDTDRSGVIGLPAPGCMVKIAPVSGKLELRARGPNVTPGYWRAPEQTRAAFDTEGFYRLGDAVRPLDPANPAHGLLFDGRIAEDFKLSTGTWVSVGPLRASLLQVLAPLALDLVIAGLDRDYLALLIWPDVRACQTTIGAAGFTQRQLAQDPRLLALLAGRLRLHAQHRTGSATRIERAAVLPEPPSIDGGEVTDKGSINQRQMLERWRELIDDIYGEHPPAHAICVAERPSSTRPVSSN
jgi:feruloyl-CoA synthase